MARVSKLESELQSKVATLHGYEVLITSLQSELLTASIQKEKALQRAQSSPGSPRKDMGLDNAENELKNSARSPRSPRSDETLAKLIDDRDAIRNALVSNFHEYYVFVKQSL